MTAIAMSLRGGAMSRRLTCLDLATADLRCPSQMAVLPNIPGAVLDSDTRHTSSASRGVLGGVSPAARRAPVAAVADVRAEMGCGWRTSGRLDVPA